MTMIAWKKFTLFTTLLFGLTYIILTPPGHVPDEPHHFYRSHHIAQGHFMAIKTQDHRMGGMIPSGYPVYFNSFRHLRYHPDQKVTLQQFKDAHQVDVGIPIFLDFPNVGYYFPTAYLPQVASNLSSGALRLKPSISLYLSRILGLGIWLLILVTSFGFLEKNQFLFSIAALTPSLLIIQSGVTADLFTNALGFLWIALILGVWEGKVQNVGTLKMIIAISIITLFTIHKPVYWPLSWLVFCIPKSVFPNQKLRWLLVLIPLIALIPWYHFLKDFFIAYDHYNPAFREDIQLNPGVDPKGQLSYIWHNPMVFAHVLISSWGDSFFATWAHWIGKFGWEANYLPSPFIILYSLILFYAGGKSILISSIRKHAIALVPVIAFLISLLTSIVIYLQWSPLAGNSISALNGRYFFLLLPLVPVIFNNLIPFNINAKYIQITIVCCHLMMILAIYLRYYHI